MATDSSADSLSYLGEVIALFGDEEAKYSEFHQIIVDFLKKKDGDEIIRRTKELFNGDERMVMGFYMLLLQQKSNKTKKKRKHIDSMGASKLISQTVWLYSNNKHLCKSFLGTLFILLREGGLPSNAYKEVAALFHDHPKVPEEFADFLFEASEATIPHFEQSHGLPAVKMFSVSSIHVHKMGENHSAHADDSNYSGDYTDPARSRKQRLVKEDKREDSNRTDHEQNMKYLESVCGELDDTMQHAQETPQMVDSSTSSDHKNNMTGFLWNEGHSPRSADTGERAIFREENINEKNISRNIKHEKDEEKKTLGKRHHLVSNNATPQRGSFPANREERKKPISQLDFSSCKSCTPSYRLLPEELREPVVGKLEASVLNDSWVISANTESYCTNSKSTQYKDSSCSKSKSNQYEDNLCSKSKSKQCEDNLFKCENDMFELDVLLGSVNMTIKRVKAILANMLDRRINPGFQFQMEKDLTSSNLRCIEQLYATYGLDVLDAIRQNSKIALPIILRRLKLWKKDLKTFRLNFHKVCKGVYAENYPKIRES